MTKSPLPEATVIAVGPGAAGKDGAVVPCSVKAGDRVLLPGWGGSPITVGDEVSFTLSESRAASGRTKVAQWANKVEVWRVVNARDGTEVGKMEKEELLEGWWGCAEVGVGQR